MWLLFPIVLFLSKLYIAHVRVERIVLRFILLKHFCLEIILCADTIFPLKSIHTNSMSLWRQCVLWWAKWLVLAGMHNFLCCLLMYQKNDLMVYPWVQHFLSLQLLSQLTTLSCDNVCLRSCSCMSGGTCNRGSRYIHSSTFFSTKLPTLTFF